MTKKELENLLRNLKPFVDIDNNKTDETIIQYERFLEDASKHTCAKCAHWKVYNYTSQSANDVKFGYCRIFKNLTHRKYGISCKSFSNK